MEGTEDPMEPLGGSSGVVIRELCIEEYGAVQRLWIDAGLPFRPRGRDDPERVARELRSGSAVFLVAEAGGEVVGVVLGTHDGRKGWINRLAVSPAYQRTGIGARLVAEVEARLATFGIDITAALIETDNETSMGFFRSAGYVHGPDIEYVSKRRSIDT